MTSMPTAETVAAFALVSALLIVVPGPSVLFIVGRALALGRRDALVTVVGNAGGVLLQVMAVAAGLGALVSRSIVVYTTIKYLGAAWLVWLGISAWRRAGTVADDESAVASAIDAGAPMVSGRRAMVEGFVVGISNPKAIAFFVAILPQYADPSVGPVGIQMAVLGVVFAVIALVLDSGWALGAGSARAWLARSPRRLVGLRRTGAVTMAGLGVHLALTGRPTT